MVALFPHCFQDRIWWTGSGRLYGVINTHRFHGLWKFGWGRLSIPVVFLKVLHLLFQPSQFPLMCLISKEFSFEDDILGNAFRVADVCICMSSVVARVAFSRRWLMVWILLKESVASCRKLIGLRVVPENADSTFTEQLWLLAMMGLPVFPYFCVLEHVKCSCGGEVEH